MKAWVCRTLRDDFSGMSYETCPPLAPGAGEVLLRLRAASLNFPDLLIAQGKYQLKPELPFTPGMEGAGEVMALGVGVTGLAVGDRVVAGLRTGAFAQEAVAEARSVRKIPGRMSYAEAAAYPAAYLTAYVSLVRRGHLEPGETLLVHGAAGGVGLAAVDVGKVLGAKVIATAASAQKREFLLQRGADHVLDYTQGFRQQVKELTEGRGADVIYDPIGGDVFDESVRCIAWDGRLLVIGFTSGRIPQISVNMPLIKGFSVVGVRAGEYGRKDPVKGAENIAQIDQWAAEEKIKPHIYAQLPLAELMDAYAMIESRKVIGKVVVTM